MYKLIFFAMMSVFFMLMQAMQFDQELAMHSLFQTKYALNRSAHAAAQQLDELKLSYGIYSIDQERAEQVALQYLRRNLLLGEDNKPLPHAFLRSEVEILEFTVINEQEVFPYRYELAAYDYSVIVYKPSVIMIIRVAYPRTFNVLGPIVWEVKGVAELVNDV